MTAKDWFKRARKENFALRHIRQAQCKLYSGQNFPAGDGGIYDS